MFNTLLSTADTQIAAAGLTAYKLTIKTMTAFLKDLFHHSAMKMLRSSLTIQRLKQ